MQLQLTWIEAKVMAASHTILLLLLPVVTGVTLQDVSYSVRHRTTRTFIDDVIKSFLHKVPSKIHANKTGHPQLARLLPILANTSNSLEHHTLQTSASTSIPHLVETDSHRPNNAIKNGNLWMTGNAISNTQLDQNSPLRSLFFNVLSGNIRNSIKDNSITTSLKDAPADLSNSSSSGNTRQDDTRLTSAHKRNYADTVSCELDVIRMDMVFREYRESDTRSYLLECRGNILVSKCEGGCEARVSPSVNHYDGFQRFCSCCRESGVTPRDVTLTQCNIGEESVHGYSLTRTIVEPSGCSCQECRN